MCVCMCARVRILFKMLHFLYHMVNQPVGPYTHYTSADMKGLYKKCSVVSDNIPISKQINHRSYCECPFAWLWRHKYQLCGVRLIHMATVYHSDENHAPRPESVDICLCGDQMRNGCFWETHTHQRKTTKKRYHYHRHHPSSSLKLS